MTDFQKIQNSLDEEFKRKGYDVKDGILDNECWEKSKLKILYLLKEANDDFVDIRNTHIDIRHGNSKTFWWNVVFWKHALTAAFENPENLDSSLPDKSNIEEVKNNNYLLKDIAYVNIKKRNFNLPTSENVDISNYAKSDKELLRQQIDLINPNVVLCCGITHQFLRYKMFYENDILEQLGEYCYKHKNRLVIDFYHPACRKGYATYSLLYNDLAKNRVLNNFAQ